MKKYILLINGRYHAEYYLGGTADIGSAQMFDSRELAEKKVSALPVKIIAYPKNSLCGVWVNRPSFSVEIREVGHMELALAHLGQVWGSEDETNVETLASDIHSLNNAITHLIKAVKEGENYD